MKEIQKLDEKGLRRFGLTTGIIVAVLFGLMFPLLLNRPFPLWPWIVVGVLWTLALLTPRTLGLVYTNWMKVGLILGWINTRIILGIAFCVIVIPTGLLMRSFGRDPMKRKIVNNLETYRMQSTKAPREKVERPF